MTKLWSRSSEGKSSSARWLRVLGAGYGKISEDRNWAVGIFCVSKPTYKGFHLLRAYAMMRIPGWRDLEYIGNGHCS